MNAISSVRLARLEDSKPTKPIDVVDTRVAAPYRRAIFSARHWLLEQQGETGAWCGRQQGDASLAARLLLLYAATEDHPDRRDDLAQQIQRQQLPSGGWAARPGAAVDLSISLLCYLALKVQCGTAAMAELRGAYRLIRQLGGALCVDAETAAWLHLFGQLPGQPNQNASGRDLFDEALTVRKSVSLSPLNGIAELFVEDKARGQSEPGQQSTDSSSVVSLIWRRLTIVEGDEEHQAYAAKLDRQIESHFDDELGLMPVQSPTNDTARVLAALLTAGVDRDSSAIHAAQEYLREQAASTGLSTPTREAAQLVQRLSNAAATSEPHQELPPDLRLNESDVTHSEASRRSQSLNRGTYSEAAETGSQSACRLVEQLLSYQNLDGGWGSHPMAESSCLTTAEVLFALSRCDCPETAEALQEGAAWLRSQQQLDGSWEVDSELPLGLATSRVVTALITAGAATDDRCILAAVNWLLAEQHESGGWGQPTASQTAWAVEALSAAGLATQQATIQGVDFLLDTQEESGEWREPHLLQPGHAPGRFRRNELDATVAALDALARWSTSPGVESAAEEEVCLRLVSCGKVGD